MFRCNKTVTVSECFGVVSHRAASVTAHTSKQELITSCARLSPSNIGIGGEALAGPWPDTPQTLVIH
jgi:hypothetical protein